MTPGRPASGNVPVINALLNLVALVEQRAIERTQVINNCFEPGPEGLRADADRRQEFVVNELPEDRGNRQRASIAGFVTSHDLEPWRAACALPPVR